MFKIKILEEDKASYKLLLRGRRSLTNSEVLSVIIGGSDEKSASIAQQMLTDVGNDLTRLTKFDLVALKRYNGVSEKCALKILASFELSARREKAEAIKLKKVSSSRDAYNFISPSMQDLNYEEFHILLLNRGNRIVKHIKISEGGLTGTIADPKKIFKQALEEKAAGVILAHNHPSGNIKPSESDIRLTQKLKKGGSLLDLPIIDHLIIGDSQYFSFADEGLL